MRGQFSVFRLQFAPGDIGLNDEDWVSWFPTHAAIHSTDEDLSVGTPANCVMNEAPRFAVLRAKGDRRSFDLAQDDNPGMAESVRAT
jgi:hypothetical protein